jgi:hypothetical protein
MLHSRIVKQFKKLERGGSDRGVSWPGFKNPWYSRADGSSVPIWGGVPKVNGERGMVKGRLRSKNPEGKKRYTQQSKLVQSTGVLRQALLSDIRIGNGRIDL